ncbi:hypothetical protein STRIP9103_02806 [Streptomyces ipomoeae 91-03]|uniref:Uncharacterized protein n=1 Tax=Streptomyces ipomoeae 91-03 TaxID=698759 RepID=L1L2Y1_9ACTN|nr:hypothetical protein STRIP9103_02806 [Streptomyces ipomoeae 91-03]
MGLASHARVREGLIVERALVRYGARGIAFRFQGCDTGGRDGLTGTACGRQEVRIRRLCRSGREMERQEPVMERQEPVGRRASDGLSPR